MGPRIREGPAEPAGGTGGDGPADFAALLARHHTALLGFVLSLVPCWSDAEDIVQETSAAMWRKMNDFRPGTSFFAWACQIARYHVMNHRRRRGRDRHVFSAEVVEALGREAESDAGRLESERVALQGCLEKLDPAGRELLRSCYAPGATVGEVARGLGRTPNSIYKTLNRVREALLNCIRRKMATEGA